MSVAKKKKVEGEPYRSSSSLLGDLDSQGEECLGDIGLDFVSLTRGRTQDQDEVGKVLCCSNGWLQLGPSAVEIVAWLDLSSWHRELDVGNCCTDPGECRNDG